MHFMSRRDFVSPARTAVVSAIENYPSMSCSSDDLALPLATTFRGPRIDVCLKHSIVVCNRNFSVGRTTAVGPKERGKNVHMQVKPMYTMH